VRAMGPTTRQPGFTVAGTARAEAAARSQQAPRAELALDAAQRRVRRGSRRGEPRALPDSGPVAEDAGRPDLAAAAALVITGMAIPPRPRPSTRCAPGRWVPCRRRTPRCARGCAPRPAIFAAETGGETGPGPVGRSPHARPRAPTTPMRCSTPCTRPPPCPFARRSSSPNGGYSPPRACQVAHRARQPLAELWGQSGWSTRRSRTGTSPAVGP